MAELLFDACHLSRQTQPMCQGTAGLRELRPQATVLQTGDYMIGQGTTVVIHRKKQ